MLSDSRGKSACRSDCPYRSSTRRSRFSLSLRSAWRTASRMSAKLSNSPPSNDAPSSFHCPHPQAQILKRRDSHRFQLGRLSADVIHSVGDQQTGEAPRGTSKLLFLSESASVK